MLTAPVTPQDYDFSSICIPRMPKQAVGAICLLTHAETGQTTTLNVRTCPFPL